MHATELLDGPQKPHTKEEMLAGLKMTVAVAETIRECGEAPEGVLYAAMMGKVTLAGFQSIIRTLTNAGLIEVHGHLCRWIGPEIRPRREVSS